MDITIFLTRIWGPVMLAAGIGFFVSGKYYVKVYRDLEKGPFAIIFFGMGAMAAAIVHINAHNIWGTFSEIIMSLLGWMLLAKGAICTIAPGIAEKSADWAVYSKIVPLAGAALLLLGGYLSWIGYFT